MAINKKEEFTKKEQELSAFAKALAHPARIAILKVLAQKNECICGQIVEVRLYVMAVPNGICKMQNSKVYSATVPIMPRNASHESFPPLFTGLWCAKPASKKTIPTAFL